jgi:anti-sigma B factor antagonist
MSGSGDGGPPFHVRSRRPGGRVVLVELGGELDIATVPRAVEYLAACTAGHPEHLVLDLSGVTFLSSYGMGLLVRARLNSDSIHGTLHLVGVAGNRHVERLLDLTGLSKELDVAPDLAVLLRELEAEVEAG